MMKLVRSAGRIQALDLMAVAMGCMVEGPMVGFVARRVRVKPLSRLQSKLMPPHPHDSGTPTMQKVYTHQMEAPETDPQARWGERRHPVLTGFCQLMGEQGFQHSHSILL